MPARRPLATAGHAPRTRLSRRSTAASSNAPSCSPHEPDAGAIRRWVAAVGPSLIDGNARWAGCHDRFPTVRQEVANVLGLRRSRAHDDVRSKVDWIEGACMMLSAIAVGEVGGLDTGYFMYSEEVDWCYRARKLGWQIACLPAARVVHFVGKSGSLRRRAQLCSSKIRL